MPLSLLARSEASMTTRLHVARLSAAPAPKSDAELIVEPIAAANVGHIPRGISGLPEFAPSTEPVKPETGWAHSTTASQAAMEDGSAVIALICACAARASMQAPDQRHGEPSSHGGDRVRHVPFGSDRRRRGVGNPRKGEALRNPRRDLGLRGENLARSAIRKP